MFRLIIIFLLLSSNLFSQKPDSTFKAQNLNLDSLKTVVTDSVKKILDTNKVTFKKFLKVVFSEEPSPKKRPALKATYRSMVLPGWGQATNKEYWVIPIVYGGVGAGIYFLADNIKNYNKFKDALNTIVNLKKPATVEYKGSTLTFQTDETERLKPAVNGFRRYRDLTFIGFGVGWALQTIQANVSAHLKSFDMSEDISFKIQPNIQSNLGLTSIGFSAKINF